ncbi:hypothetical protein CK203_087475 [Vitis vinifera]|uniref:Retrotransposon Copia-like N-terminal domain-containing protein n=1 Tax=Vitis vinifera TaxID=29760 RepID=A0A438EN97_VITVI|nr:hypothetical protein CK203_087475 [Vitis vinifera]
MATKNPIFTSVISGSLTITSKKLIGSENYLSWSAFVELWFMGQGYEDHLVTPEDAIPDVDKADKFFMVLTLIGFRPDLESVRDQILASPSVPSLDDVLTLEEDVSGNWVEDNVLSAPIVISLVTLEIVAISYMDGLLALPTLLSHLILCYLDLTPLRAPHLRVSPLLVVIMMPISDIRQPHQLLLLLLPRPIMSLSALLSLLLLAMDSRFWSI